MAVSTIYQGQRGPNKTNKLLYVLILIGLLAVVYFGISFAKNYWQLGGKSRLSAELFYGEGGVYLNDELLGPLPFESDDVQSGEKKLTMKGNGVEYEVTLNFLPKSEVIIKRDLGVSQAFSAGQNFWLEKSESGNVLSIISEPTDVDVYIDGSKVGKTPYSNSELTNGEYDLRLQKDGYEPQTARLGINEGFKLNVSASLFPKPVPDKVSLLEDSSKLYDVNSDNSVVTSDTQAWVDAIVYWNETRGINLDGVGNNTEQVFDFFLDSAGNLYTAGGTKVSVDSADFIESAERGAYLRKVSDGPGLSDAAKETFSSLGETGIGAKQATILETGLGWLRVRDEPGLDGQELTTVTVGNSFEVLEEETGWVKIKVSDTVEGWVSDTYVSIE